jgi:hypothetical protein
MLSAVRNPAAVSFARGINHDRVAADVMQITQRNRGVN